MRLDYSTLSPVIKGLLVITLIIIVFNTDDYKKKNLLHVRRHIIHVYYSWVDPGLLYYNVSRIFCNYISIILLFLYHFTYTLDILCALRNKDVLDIITHYF